MALLKIARLGNPVLRHKARAVAPEEIGLPEFQQLIDDMLETMRAAQGVGLAAPQAGRDLRLLVYEAQENERYPGRGPVGLRVLINPQITPASELRESDWEGCLSIPELRGLVPRYSAVRVSALDRAGLAQEFDAAGFEARIIQHELDHLDGIIFLDRMEDMMSLTYLEEQRIFGGEDESKI